MATQNDNPARSDSATVAEPGRSDARVVEFDEYIDAQLRKTRSHVRSVDIATSLMVLVTGTLAYFLVAAMFDHWIVTGGLGFWGRMLFLSVFVIAALAFLSARVGPLFLYKINPLYAAHTIERSQPSLKNTLVNFLFFRGDRSRLNPVVYQAIEEQAATNLAGAHADAAVDRSNLIKIGYVLSAILLVSALYAVISPKGLFRTVGRIAAPWAEIGAPTSTTITQIEPGDTQAFRGQQVEVTARIQDLPDDGSVVLYYTTVDGQIVDRAIEMVVAADGYKHTAMLPAGSGSLQQNLDYRIEAGDAITREFHAQVVDAPTIFVDSVDYQYPKYTGLLAQRVERQGDIKAIEGTRVTIEGLANGNIDSAHLDFDCDGTLDRRMTVDGPRAKATFRLALDSDRKQAGGRSYQLVFTNEQGQRNPQPVRHQIEVTRDIPPEIEFVAPSKDEVDLPANGVLTWEIVANDPDFALRMVKLSAEKGERPLFDKVVLDETRPGQFVAKYRFRPAKLGLKAGDVVEYWAVAEDNKDPRPNRTDTPKRRIRIVAPGEGQSDQDQLARNDQEGKDDQQPDDPRAGNQGKQSRDENGAPEENPDQPQEGDPRQDDEDRNASQRKQGDDQQDEGQQGQGEQDPDEQGANEQGQGQQGKGQQGEGQQGEGTDSDDTADSKRGGQQKDGQGQQQSDEPGVASDGSNDGDAIERILKHRQQQDDPNQSKQSQSKERQEQPPNQRQRSDGQTSEQSADQPPAGDQRQPSGEQPTAPRDKSAGRQQPKSSDGGEKQQGRPQKGQPDSGAGKRRDQQPDADRQPADQPDERAGSDPKQGDGKPGEKKEVPKQQPAGDDARREDSPREGGGDKSRGDKSDGDEGQRGGQSKEGQGAQSKSDPMGNKSPPSRDAQRPDAKGGDGQRDKGESGAGKKSQDNQGSPSPQDSNQPRDKSPQPPSEDDESPQDRDQPQSPSQSKRESDSAGNDDGDRSGGGKRGGGQKANKPGTGGAGQNTAADEGAGVSEQAGDGETSDRAGDDRAADKQTGRSGSDKGTGSSQQRSSRPDGQPGSESEPDTQAESGDAAEKPPSGSGSTPGGGTPSGGDGGGSPDDRQPPERPYRTAPEVADKANLEYARKATDLALSHLKDELAKDQPDPELLDNLGWTRDDLRKFVDRWEQMRNDAQAPNDPGRSAKRELDDTLRSLGLRPRATRLRGNDDGNDQFKGLRESRRSSPPPEYVEQTKAYTQGTARGGK